MSEEKEEIKTKFKGPGEWRRQAAELERGVDNTPEESDEEQES